MGGAIIYHPLTAMIQIKLLLSNKYVITKNKFGGITPFHPWGEAS